MGKLYFTFPVPPKGTKCANNLLTQILASTLQYDFIILLFQI